MTECPNEPRDQQLNLLRLAALKPDWNLLGQRLNARIWAIVDNAALRVAWSETVRLRRP